MRKYVVLNVYCMYNVCLLCAGHFSFFYPSTDHVTYIIHHHFANHACKMHISLKKILHLSFPAIPGIDWLHSHTVGTAHKL